MFKQYLKFTLQLVISCVVWGYFAYVLFTLSGHILNDKNADNFGYLILVLILGLFGLFCSLLFLLSMLCIPIFILSIAFQRRHLGIPKPVYNYYLDHLNNGKKLLGIGEKEDFDPNTPVPDSITSYKFATLELDSLSQSMFFRSLTYRDEIFDIKCQAKCKRKDKHHSSLAPQMKCTCGIYSCLSFDELLAGVTIIRQFLSKVLLICNISGRIIEASNGNRAERLEVLEVKICRYCYFCNRKRRKDIVYATKIGVIGEDSTRIYAENVDSSTVYGKLLIPLCDAHKHNCSYLFTLQDLREKLGVDVSWYEIEPLAKTG